MIEESLLKSNYIGKDGFIWWLGQVAPAKYWRTEKSKIDEEGKWAYRCKVRIIGYHTFNRTVLKEDDLPWAHIMVDPADGSAQGALGATHNLAGGETVFGFFLDGDDAQQPVIVGCLYRNENVKSFILDENDDGYKPFTGNSGSLIQGLTQIKPRNIATLVQPERPTTPPVGVGESSAPGTPADKIREKEEDTGKDKLIEKDAAAAKFSQLTDVTIINENGCDNNPIGKITRALQDFIAFTNGVQKYLDVYVYSTLNAFVDMTYQVKRFANIILGSVKFIVNNMRSSIMKLVGCLFSKFIGAIVPLPQQPIIGEATKNILNIIFCLFEKLIPFLIDFVTNLLNNIVGKAINSSLCAAEEFTASILSKLMSQIENLLEPVMSGLDWLLGGLSQITSVLSKASSLANQIISFIGCDGLKCNTPSQWSSRFGPSKLEQDNWNRTLGKMNVLSRLNNDIEDSLGFLSIFGSSDTPFKDCSDKTSNPGDQDDLTSVPAGYQYPYCIPPKVKIIGDGFNAQAVPIVSESGKILSVEIIKSGRGYSRPPEIRIVDNSGYGKGAKAAAKIRGGKITEIYVKKPGSGYCKPNYNNVIPLPTYYVTADRYTVYEGETINFTINTSNVEDGTILQYRLNGSVNSNDIDGGNTSGPISINQNKGLISIKTKQDSNSEGTETLQFDVYDSSDTNVARAIVIVGDSLSPIIPPQINDPTNPPAGDDETAVPNIPVGEDPSDPEVDSPVGIGTDTVGIVTSVVVDRPGYGYTGGDTVTIGDCVFSLQLSPDGSILSVIPGECNTNFREPPVTIINTQTGAGAELYPVVKYVPQLVRTSRLPVTQVGIVSVIDCV